MHDDQGIYEAKPGDASELERALGLCLIGSSAPAQLTWTRGAYGEWFDGTFRAVLASHLLEVCSAEKTGEWRRAIQADTALALPATSIPASTAAGRKLVSALDGASHLAVVRRFRDAVLTGNTPGHFATALALQASTFHVPLLTLLTGYAYLEWRSSLSASGKIPLIVNFLETESAHLAALPTLIYEHPGSPYPTHIVAL